MSNLFWDKDGTAVVMPTVRARTMGKSGLVTVRAFHSHGRLKLPVSAPFAAARPGDLMLW